MAKKAYEQTRLARQANGQEPSRIELNSGAGEDSVFSGKLPLAGTAPAAQTDQSGIKLAPGVKNSAPAKSPNPNSVNADTAKTVAAILPKKIQLAAPVPATKTSPLFNQSPQNNTPGANAPLSNQPSESSAAPTPTTSASTPANESAPAPSSTPSPVPAPSPAPASNPISTPTTSVSAPAPAPQPAPAQPPVVSQPEPAPAPAPTPSRPPRSRHDDD